MITPHGGEPEKRGKAMEKNLEKHLDSGRRKTSLSNGIDRNDGVARWPRARLEVAFAQR